MTKRYLYKKQIYFVIGMLKKTYLKKKDIFLKKNLKRLLKI